MDRRRFLTNAAIAGSLVKQASGINDARFILQEATISDLQSRMKRGELTAEKTVTLYLERIDEIDRRGPALNSVIEINPDALSIARSLDEEYRSKGPRGPLHGVPLLLKDNIDTDDHMETTAGSLALVGASTPSDSFVVRRLRAAGAVILGKTNLSEWANFRSTHSTSGWSARGGQTKNPYALDRNPCGSSSGSGVAVSANLTMLAIGTETDGSIVCPSSMNGIVGIKPTLGLVSRTGIIPVAHSQDTAGPMARTVRDAATLLGVLTGVDERDPITMKARAHTERDYTKFLDANGLKGARIGVARQYFGINDHTDRLMEESIAAIKALGATIVDPANMDSSGKYDASEGVVLSYEFKADVNKYLAGAHANVRSRTLADLIKFNEEHHAEELQYFGQEQFIAAEKRGPLTTPEYTKALAKNRRLSRAEGIDLVLKKHKLDALIAPTGGPVWPTDLVNGDHYTGGYSSASAVAGYPHITVPAGFVFGLPVGLSFFAEAWSEPKLIKFAYAFEQATKARKAPRFLATI